MNLSTLLLPILAQGDAPPPPQGMNPLFLMLIFGIMMYFLMIRPQQKRAKEAQAMQAGLFVSGW